MLLPEGWRWIQLVRVRSKRPLARATSCAKGETMTQLARTSSPGIYRAHGTKCNGTGRCDCPYVIMWRHRGRQHKETCRTFNEAREEVASRLGR